MTKKVINRARISKTLIEAKTVKNISNNPEFSRGKFLAKGSTSFE